MSLSTDPTVETLYQNIIRNKPTQKGDEMTQESIPADIFDSSDLEDQGWYNWRVAAPGTVADKDEYDANGPTGRTYKAISAFLIAQEQAEFDQDGILAGAEKPLGVSVNCNFKITKPDGKWDKKGLAKLKSLFVVNTGAAPKAVEDENGDLTYDIKTLAVEMTGFSGWCPLVHGEDKDKGTKFQYLQGNFRKSAPEKVKV